MPAEGPASFFVSWPGALQDEFAAIEDLAKQKHLLNELLADMKAARERLQSDPLGWGDPQYEYHHLGLLVLHATLRLVHFYYAVDDIRRIVYVQEILAMPGSGLEE